jgi:hypothetical protein
MNRVAATFVAVVVMVGVTACRGAKRPAERPTAAVPGATLWESPTDLRSRDLVYGPWGRERAPDPRATYTLEELKHSGVNPGMTVTDPQGREWSVKQAYPGGLDNEGPVEVAVSRLLSAVGYHQPPVYYLPTFTLKDDWGTHVERGGRFRLKEQSLKEEGAWKWEENPFVGTRPYQGLLVLLMMFNSTDLKNSNNSLYHYKRAGRVEQWYVVRDVGAALGDTHPIESRKNHASSFERQPFILGLNNGHVEFAYKGWYKNLVRGRITPDDVAWASDLLGRLTDRQLSDAFRAGGYAPEIADRFIRKLRKKIVQGQTVKTGMLKAEF